MPKARRVAKKTADVRAHAMARAFERYGLELQSHDFDYLHARIRKSECTASYRHTGTRTVFLISYQGLEVLGVYDRNLSHISTFLPPDARERALLDEIAAEQTTK